VKTLWTFEIIFLPSCYVLKLHKTQKFTVFMFFVTCLFIPQHDYNMYLSQVFPHDILYSLLLITCDCSAFADFSLHGIIKRGIQPK